MVMEQCSETPVTTPNAQGSLIVDMKTEFETIPSYLTKRNESFQQLMRHAQSVMITTAAVNLEELRKISILIYKIMIIQTYHLLWTTYLKSGRGQLFVPADGTTTIPIWPKELQAFFVQHSTTNQTNENDMYLTCVNSQLSELDRQLKQSKNELNTKANNLHGYTLTVQKSIEAYIEQYLRPFRTGIEHRVELIHYDYSIRTLKLEFLRHHPTAHQVGLSPIDESF